MHFLKTKNKYMLAQSYRDIIIFWRDKEGFSVGGGGGPLGRGFFFRGEEGGWGGGGGGVHE